MTLIADLEKKVAEWVKPVPDLPRAGQKWIADNVWWLCIIALIGSIISVFATIAALISYGTYSAVTSIYLQSYTGPKIYILIASLIFIAVSTVVLATAINPLKLQQRKGWSLLFILLVINAMSVVVGAVLTLNVVEFIFSLLIGAIGLGIGAYFLYQIKSFFVSHAKTVTPDKK